MIDAAHLQDCLSEARSVNYYEHHLGDYLRDTAHLSMVEDGAYRRLLDAYYIKELPLPKAVRDIYRLVRAGTKPERDAVSIVLTEFFEEAADGWHHKRCDAEIARYRESEPDREAKRENERERQRRARERRKQLFDSLRQYGLVPAYDAQISELQRMLSQAESQHVTQHVTRDATATQTPDTRHQTPISKEAKASSSAARLPTCPTQALIDLYHEILPNLPAVRIHTKSRTRAIRKAWEWVLTSKRTDQTPRATSADEALDWFRNYFQRATENDFLMGKTPRSAEHANWKCDLDFLLTEKGMKHVIEKTGGGS